MKPVTIYVLIKSFMTGVILVIAYVLLSNYLAEKNIVALILSAGQHTPFVYVLTAMVFFVLRLAVILLIPALLCYRLGFFLVDSYIMKNMK